MSRILENYIRLTIGDLKRTGFLKPCAFKRGSMMWYRGDRPVASVSVQSDLLGQIPSVVLSYKCDGVPVRDSFALKFQASNLGDGAGYYYFICPETGKACRNLYLVDGRFMSRPAFRPLYKKQARRRPAGVFGMLAAACEYEDLIVAKYRRYTYRGRLTPYGRKVEKKYKQVAALFGLPDPPV